MNQERAINYIKDKETTLAKTQFDIADTLAEIRDYMKGGKQLRGSIFLGSFNSESELPDGNGVQVGDWALVNGDIYYIQ